MSVQPNKALFSALLCCSICCHSIMKTAEACEDPGSGHAGASNSRQQLDATFLLGQQDMTAPVSTSAFKPPGTRLVPSHQLSGHLEIPANPHAGHASAIKDDDGRLLDADLEIQHLPPLNADFVQNGSDIIPTQRGPQPSSHPYWEWVLEPGVAWDEPGDPGFSRAAIPFSLQQRNQNCTHHGMLTFLFRSNGETSRVAYQVVSETCIWLMADLWGVRKIEYTPGTVEQASEIIERYRQDVARRLPVKSIEMINEDYPGIEPGRFEPQSPEHATLWGLVADGVHYTGGCQTRYGPYPFCHVLDLPSYSTAKSVFAGLGYMYLERRYPGLGREKVTGWIPECILDDNRWRDVELRHLVNMTTGLYNSAEYMADENRITHTPFIQGDTHQEKVNFACRQYERHREPGQHWVYHTSDSYLAGLLMRRYLQKYATPGTDLFQELLVKTIWKAIGLSALTETTRRTYDELAQPFTGYGLSFHPDDVAQIARWLNSTGSNRQAERLFDPQAFTAAMQTLQRTAITPLSSMGLDYRYGFWAAEASSWVGCKGEVWVPFMSGFGGITIALLPNDMVYYYFSDSGIFRWADPVIEAHKIRPICEN